MRLIELKCENFKRLTAVHLKPTGAVTPITGKNGAGKTSVLDAIAAALGGGAEAPELPIRTGQSRAEVVVDLGDITVRRRWTAKGSSLVVETKDGAAYKSPQAVLDKLVGELSFDPLQFTRLKPTEQAGVLAKVAGINLALHGIARQALYTDRAAANKAAKEVRAQLAGMPPIAEGVPDEEVSVSVVMDELTAAQAERRAYVTAEGEVGTRTTAAVLAQRRAEDARVELERAEKAWATARVERAVAAERLANLAAPPDEEPIRQRGRELEATNRAVRSKKLRATKEADELRTEALAKEITQKIEALDADLAAKLRAAALPVPGLALGESGVTVAGIPFSQCSGAEKLRVSLAIGLALNPKLKLMLIRDGSLLDDAGMHLLAELADGAGAQLIIERVSNGERVGVVIVDGSTEPEESPVVATTPVRGVDALPLA